MNTCVQFFAQTFVIISLGSGFAGPHDKFVLT